MRPPATSRDAIDEVALGLFVAHGYENVATRQLIEACGISRPTFFRYVASRDAIILDQITRFGDLVADLVRRRDEAHAWASLREAMCEAVDSLQPDSRTGMAFRILQASPGIRASALNLTRLWRAQLTDALTTRGHFAGEGARCEAAAAMAIGLVQMMWAKPTPTSTDLRRAFDDAHALTETHAAAPANVSTV